MPVAAVVMKLLRKQPDERHTSAREAREALVAAGEGRAVVPCMDASASPPIAEEAAAVADASAPSGPAEPIPEAAAVVDPALASASRRVTGPESTYLPGERTSPITNTF